MRETIVFVTAFVLILFNVVLLMIGVLEGRAEFRSACRHPLARVEVLVPGFRVGCWLGKPIFSEQLHER